MRLEGAAAIWPDTRPNDEPQAPRSLVGISEFSKLSASARAHPMAPHRPPTRSLAAGAEIARPPRGQAPREEISDHRASQRPSGASRPGVKNPPQFRRRENLVGGRGSTARGPKCGPHPSPVASSEEAKPGWSFPVYAGETSRHSDVTVTSRDATGSIHAYAGETAP